MTIRTVSIQILLLLSSKQLQASEAQTLKFIEHRAKECSFIFSSGAPLSIQTLKGSTDPFSGDGAHLDLTTTRQLQTHGRLDARTSPDGKDLVIHVRSGNTNEPASLTGQVENGLIDAIVLPTNPSRIAAAHKDIIADGKVALMNIEHVDQKLVEQHTQVMRRWLPYFFGFHFIAQAKNPVPWKIVVTTDVSDQRSRELNKTLTFEATFIPPLGSDGYVNIPLGRFRSMLGNQDSPEEPSLGSPDYPAKNLVLTSFKLMPAEPASEHAETDLVIRHSEIDMGSMYGFELDQAVAFFEDMANAMDTQSPTSIGLAEGYRTMAKLLPRLKKNARNSPVAAAFSRLTSESQRRSFLEKILSRMKLDLFEPYSRPATQNPQYFSIGDELGGPNGGKVSIFDLWNNVNHYLIPFESGYFASVHGRYVHALQLIELFKGSTPEEQRAIGNLIASPVAFQIFWNVGLDNRAGGIGDPAWWRQLYEPVLLHEAESGVSSDESSPAKWWQVIFQ